MAVRFPIQIMIKDGLVYADGFCNSSDQKPANIDGMAICQGSSLYETDTSDSYMYDEDSTSWIKQGGDLDA